MLRGLAAAVWVGALVGLLGCGRLPWSAPSESGSPPSFPADSSMARVQQRGQLVVGVKYDTPPFGSLNPLTNQVEGFDADLGRELARVLFGDEAKVQFVEALSGNRIPFLQDDRVDVVLSTMTITDERRQVIDFCGALLRRRAVDPGAPGEPDPGRKRPERPHGRLGARLHQRAEPAQAGAPGHAAAGTGLRRGAGGAEGPARRRGEHRRYDPDGDDAARTPISRWSAARSPWSPTGRASRRGARSS